MINKSIQKERIYHIELLRIIACFFVIVNHTNSNIFLNRSPDLTWVISVTYFFVSKLAVPVFIMITGYVSLIKQDSYKKTLSKVFRMVIVLVVFSAFYYIYQALSGTRPCANIVDFFENLLAGTIITSFWYLYLYIGILLMMPFLQRFVKALDKKDFHVFFAISAIVFSIWPILVHYIPELNYTASFQIPLFNSYICMLFIGYYFRLYGEANQKKDWVFVGVFAISLLGNVVLTFGEYMTTQGADYLFYDNRTLVFIMLEAVSIFYFASYFKCSEKKGKIIRTIGECTFGIYLIADYVTIKTWFLYQNLCCNLHPVLAVVLWEVTIFSISFLIVWILKKIPGIKKLI